MAVEAARVCLFGHLQAAGRSELTIRSYGLDLLRWFRFLWAAGVAWDQATQAEAREFCRWLVVAGKPVRPHWRERRLGPDVPGLASGQAYAPSVRAHCETVLRGFTAFMWRRARARWSTRSRWTGREGAAARSPQPDEPYRRERSGLYRPVVPSRIPRNVPDEEFNAIFTALGSHRDRALVALYVSTGARASELLSATRSGADPGRQLITVARKGTTFCRYHAGRRHPPVRGKRPRVPAAAGGPCQPDRRGHPVVPGGVPPCRVSGTVRTFGRERWPLGHRVAQAAMTCQ